MYNTPSKVNSDNGTHFVNKAISDFCKNRKINWQHSTTHSPQTQGLVERMNGILKKTLQKYFPKTNDEWLETVQEVTSTYNSTPIDHFQGKTPFYLLHGYNKKDSLQNSLGGPTPIIQKTRENEIEDVVQAREKVPEQIKKAALKNKKYYDKNKTIHDFELNDLV